MEIWAFGGSFFVSQQGKLTQNEREEEEMMSEIAHKIGTIAWSDHLSITDETIWILPYSCSFQMSRIIG